jgi:hypothetical protein
MEFTMENIYSKVTIGHRVECIRQKNPLLFNKYDSSFH